MQRIALAEGCSSERVERARWRLWFGPRANRARCAVRTTEVRTSVGVLCGSELLGRYLPMRPLQRDRRRDRAGGIDRDFGRMHEEREAIAHGKGARPRHDSRADNRLPEGDRERA